MLGEGEETQQINLEKVSAARGSGVRGVISAAPSTVRRLVTAQARHRAAGSNDDMAAGSNDGVCSGRREILPWDGSNRCVPRRQKGDFFETSALSRSCHLCLESPFWAMHIGRGFEGSMYLLRCSIFLLQARRPRAICGHGLSCIILLVIYFGRIRQRVLLNL